MKRVIFAIFLCSFSIIAPAQFINRFSIDLNLFRFSKETGITSASEYDYSLSYINGLALNYDISEKWRGRLGFRKFGYSVFCGGLYTFEDLKNEGLEISTGAQYKIDLLPRLSMYGGLEFFVESSVLDGLYHTDVPPFTYDIHHHKKFIGGGPSVSIQFRLTEHIFFFADTRVRFGNVVLDPISRKRWDKPLFYSYHFEEEYYEPISAMGLRIKL